MLQRKKMDSAEPEIMILQAQFHKIEQLQIDSEKKTFSLRKKKITMKQQQEEEFVPREVV